MIFSRSVYTEVIPQDWRDGNVNPLHKKGSSKQCNKYRPVPLTSQIVKIFERLLLDQIFDNLQKIMSYLVNIMDFKMVALVLLSCFNL